MIHPIKIRTTFIAADCRMCALHVIAMRNIYGTPLKIVQAEALDRHQKGGHK